MKKYGLPILLGVALMASAFVVGGCDDDGNVILQGSGDGSVIVWSQQDTGVWVNGLGEITAEPDLAILVLGVEIQASTVEQAQVQAAFDMDAVIQSLKDNGVADKDIATRQYSIYPVKYWNDGQEILVGYRVTNTVTVKVRNLEDTGVIIDNTVKAGGDSIRVNSIGFTIEDTDMYYEEARELAMENAKDKASQLAALSDVDLGKPTYISEGSFYSPVIYYDNDRYLAEAGATPVTPISAGEMTISLTVQVVYGIK
ncbi:MAG: SIMPL domain-containing protein [Chloroflexi bacterium]|nr:SIMPL domain-containing protein [Chloroflexota bacterium]